MRADTPHQRDVTGELNSRGIHANVTDTTNLRGTNSKISYLAK